MVKRNKYQARKSITKMSCRISSLRKVVEEVEGPCETLKTVVLVYRSAGRWCSRVSAPGLLNKIKFLKRKEKGKGKGESS